MNTPLVASSEPPVDEQRPSLLLLSHLRAAHVDVLACMSALEVVTSADVPDPRDLTGARFKISQASFVRRQLWQRIRNHLAGRLSELDANVLRELTDFDLNQFRNSSAHVSRWTTEAVLRDWPAYRSASREIRMQMTTHIETEQALLYPLLQKYQDLPECAGANPSVLPDR